jgi:hypothetical protein
MGHVWIYGEHWFRAMLSPSYCSFFYNVVCFQFWVDDFNPIGAISQGHGSLPLLFVMVLNLVATSISCCPIGLSPEPQIAIS